jgi:hypothetical protein
VGDDRGGGGIRIDRGVLCYKKEETVTSERVTGRPTLIAKSLPAYCNEVTEVKKAAV